MAVQPEINFLVVAAIDFGTARSGYGFAFSAKPEDIICPTDWIGGQGVDLKTLTNILLDNRTSKYTHFGYEAREEYYDQCEDGGDDLFFETFKMSLYKKDGMQNKLTSACGVQVEPHIVFREALAFMKDQVLKKINVASANGEIKVRARDVLWVVTVPGMWQDKSKAFMRRAAEDAGMGIHHNLILALEPEAASFHVRSEVKEADIPIGGKYIVVDCGGGTVDFACHKISENGIVETHPATGGAWGSTYIDRSFISLMCDIFTKEKIWNFKGKNPSTWLEFISNWEAAKLLTKDFKKPRRVRIPYSLLRYLGEEEGIKTKCRNYTNSAKAKKLNQTITFSEGFKLGGDTLQSLFMPLLEQISKKIAELMTCDEVSDSTHLFVVGGFAESQVLRQHLEYIFPKLTHATPFRPGLCVIKGSVKYGLDPSTVVARKCTYTYGIGFSVLFIEGVHPESQRHMRNGVARCNGVFKTFVRKGQIVEVNECVSATLRFMENSTSAFFAFFTSTETDPVFITDDGCKQIGKLTVRKPSDARGGMDREIKCDMLFGGTEILVTVTTKSGDKLNCKLDFIFDGM